MEKQRSRKEIACHYVENITSSALDTTILADDFSVWTSTVGHIDGKPYVEGLDTARRVWKTPLKFKIELVLERHNCVVVMASSDGVLITDRKYGNDYLFVIDFDANDRIRYVREYFDTARIEALYRPAVRMLTAMQA